MPQFDRHNDLAHKVEKQELAKFMLNNQETVTAACGKEWAPTFISLDGTLPLSKELCPHCFMTHALAA